MFPNTADFLVTPGRTVKLAEFDPGATGDFHSKADAQAKLRADIKRLAALQDVFYADGRYALLVIFQGMDAAGKDGAIKHVMSGVNPQGVGVTSFKTPSAEELAHDYLWRAVKALPERGRIGIFNRSYYEELAIVRVHPELLDAERLPVSETAANVWNHRCDDITAFERHLARNGTLIVKCFLHLSQHEQRERLLKRIERPEKNWKLSAADMREREFWDRYEHAYEELLTNTSSTPAPWYIIPADHKWYTRAAVAQIIVEQLERLNLTYPSPNAAMRAQLSAAREELTDRGAQGNERR